MKFSLATALVITLWISIAAAVWHHRHPWYQVDYPPTEIRELFGRGGRLEQDGRQIIAMPGAIYQTSFAVFDVKTGSPLAEIPYKPNGHGLEKIDFVDSDTIVAFEFYIRGCTEFIYTPLIFRRRFPEWRWGHFYRPEVWVLIALSAMILWRAVRARRNLSV